ncbi:hypothetical protein [Kineococcus sp. SYSU DK002]|uniref:hypothetical protein n=1 Tax=Kineococcus sp. SYSU DK002 TaxID=3383123 RepID=UPI003D7E5981
MPLHFAENTAVLSGAVVVDDAEPLAAWLRATPDPHADLAGCRHLHTAALQALLAARVKVGAAPADEFLRVWVLPLLQAAPAEDPAAADEPADAEDTAQDPAEDTAQDPAEPLPTTVADVPTDVPADAPADVPVELPAHPAPEEALR